VDGGPPGRRKPTEPELRRILTLVGLGLIGLYLLLFIILNANDVQVSFVFFSADVSLIWVILLSVVLGAIAGPLLMRLLRRRFVRDE
jgi:uncharacterized integral membrane protein